MKDRYYGVSFYDGLGQGSLRSAKVTLAKLFELYRPTSVVDFGCGIGTWLRAARDLGVEEILGIDGDYVRKKQLQISPDAFIAADLARETVSLDRRFDLAMSLEVAEHLPKERSEAFVRQLVDASDVVLFSAAVPDQGGRHHVNEQFASYWVKRFRAEGYECYDAVRPLIWSDDRVEWWYRQNILLFAKDRVFPGRKEAATDYDMIHPQMWLNRGAIGRRIDRAARGLRHFLSQSAPPFATALVRGRHAARPRLKP